MFKGYSKGKQLQHQIAISHSKHKTVTEQMGVIEMSD